MQIGRVKQKNNPVTRSKFSISNSETHHQKQSKEMQIDRYSPFVLSRKLGQRKKSNQLKLLPLELLLTAASTSLHCTENKPGNEKKPGIRIRPDTVFSTALHTRHLGS
ncbi:hypothetical protein AVEN_64110-1 [Araneus ventricosus]|uniref:Uncharacterized protein n=1 Tax=Araneus ventricosus TaxID=182803 RepID=A0A4Y2C4V9_ARAVE|nr:hypothetical protein AVEN_64110-1 [Araneus ventricosus]